MPRPPPVPKVVAIPPGDEHQSLGVEDQQLLLDVVRRSFPQCEDYETLKPVLKDVKGAVDAGDLEKAFGGDEGREKREAWVVRWGAAKAVWFANLLVTVVEKFEDEPLARKLLGDEEEEKDAPVKVVSFGGGPAELMAMGGLIRHLCPDARGRSSAELQYGAEDPDAPPVSGQIVDLHLVNSIYWSPEISTSHASLITPPTLSKYASASALANSAPFLAKTALSPVVHQLNVLEASQEELSTLLGNEAALITLFYTVADLAATSVAKTVALLLKLTIASPRGSLVVVFDRAEVDGDDEGAEGQEDGGKKSEKRRYPLRYLLDMTLLGKKHSTEELDEGGEKPAWKMLLMDEERVVKVTHGLRYALGLDTAKAQVYVFRRL